MKKFNEVAHLYLGVDVVSTAIKSMGKLVMVGQNDNCIVVDPNGDPRGHSSYLNWLKPILKPISKITVEELKEIATICYKEVYDYKPKFKDLRTYSESVGGGISWQDDGFKYGLTVEEYRVNFSCNSEFLNINQFEVFQY